ncbi:MAG: DUF2087 domain-containing protein [Nanoarchaeota archaeon]
MITLPRDDVQKQEILARIASAFDKDRNYSEQEVNEKIRAFDVDDHTLIRRELVNFGYLGKDTAKGIYWVKEHKLDKQAIEQIKATQDRIDKSGFY